MPRLLLPLVLLTTLVGCELLPAAATPPAAPSPVATAHGSADTSSKSVATPAPSPTSGAAPAPAATAPARAATAIPRATVLARATLETAFSGERALADVRWLAEGIGSRPAGSDAERRAAEGLAERLRQLRYEVRLQPFPVRRFEDRGASLRISGEPGLEVPVRSLVNSAAGTVRGRLVEVGLGRREDLAGRDLAGAVALVARGEITFAEKVRNVAAAGAVGAAVYNQGPGAFQGAITGESSIPAVALAGEDGQRLAQRLAAQPLSAELRVDAAVLHGTSHNVVATLPGPSERVIVLGGHYDSVAEGPGANDNASGTATALELARVLRARGGPFTVRVVLFGAEEVGLVGSRAYVAALSPAERGRIVAMLNIDMIGVGERPAVSGSDELVSLAVDLAAQEGVQVRRMGGGRGDRGSDHAPFREVGVPAIFFYRGDDPRYHSADDRAEYVQARHLEFTGRLALALLDRLARG